MTAPLVVARDQPKSSSMRLDERTGRGPERRRRRSGRAIVIAATNHARWIRTRDPRAVDGGGHRPATNSLGQRVGHDSIRSSPSWDFDDPALRGQVPRRCRRSPGATARAATRWLALDSAIDRVPGAYARGIASGPRGDRSRWPCHRRARRTRDAGCASRRDRCLLAGPGPPDAQTGCAAARSEPMNRPIEASHRRPPAGRQVPRAAAARVVRRRSRRCARPTTSCSPSAATSLGQAHLLTVLQPGPELDRSGAGSSWCCTRSGCRSTTPPEGQRRWRRPGR